MASEKDRRIASTRAQAINYLKSAVTKRPKITRFENCTMDIDTARGVITVVHDGRIKVLVTHIPISRFGSGTITIISATERIPGNRT